MNLPLALASDQSAVNAALLVSALLFATGLVGFLSRRNIVSDSDPSGRQVSTNNTRRRQCD